MLAQLETGQATRQCPDTYDMVLVHRLFRRLLGDLPYLIRGTAAGDVARATVVGTTLRDQLAELTRHHTIEDTLLWPLLAARLDDPAVLLRAEEQHEHLQDLVLRAERQLRTWSAAADSDTAAALADTVEALHRELDAHLVDEETHLLPLIERHLTVAEWSRVTAAARDGRPLGALLSQLGWVLDGLDAPLREGALARLPWRVRAAWHLSGRRRWRCERDRLYDICES